jgi:AcrR family transcriptional regulator
VGIPTGYPPDREDLRPPAPLDRYQWYLDTLGMRTVESRADRRARTRTELIDAAEALFTANGFHATSLDAVADTAGYTKGAVYSNFSSKEDLFFAVYERRVERHIEHVGGLFGEGDDAGEGILRVVTAVGELRRRRADGWMAVFLEFWTHVLRHPEHRARFGELHRRAVEPFVVATERLEAEHGAPLAIPPRPLATAMFAMENGIALERLTDADAAEADLPVRLVQLLFGALTGDGRGV